MPLPCILGSLLPLSDTGQVEQKLEQASSARRDLEDSSKQIRSLEKQLKSMKQERDDLQKVHSFTQAMSLTTDLFESAA